MCGQTLAKGGVTRASNATEAGHKVMLGVWDIKGQPSQLCGRNMNSGVDGEEVGLCVGVVGEIGLKKSCQPPVLLHVPSLLLWLSRFRWLHVRNLGVRRRAAICRAKRFYLGVLVLRRQRLSSVRHTGQIVHILGYFDLVESFLVLLRIRNGC